VGNFLSELNTKIPIHEGTEGHRAVLREIYRAGHISLKDLARQCRMPLPVVAKIVNFLVEKEVLDRIPEGILYTEKGMQFIEKELHFYGFGIAGCETCFGQPIYLSPRWDDLIEKLDEILALRPTVDTTLDQSLADSETNVQRALLLYDYGALEDKRVICLGDDDFTSVAIGLLYLGLFPEESHLIPTELAVAEIDKRILDKIKQIFDTEGLPITTTEWDYRTPVPSSLKNHYDTVLVDPPYSLEGAKLALSRAIDILRPGSGKEIYFSFAHWAPEDLYQLQKLIIEMGLAIQEIYPSFNFYEGAEILGNESQMFRLITTSQTKSLIAASETHSAPLYTDDMHPTIRYYYCNSCRKMIEIGRSQQIQTIEQLKAVGCPYCQSEGPFQLDEKVELNDEMKDDIHRKVLKFVDEMDDSEEPDDDLSLEDFEEDDFDLDEGEDLSDEDEDYDDQDEEKEAYGPQQKSQASNKNPSKKQSKSPKKSKGKK
jgi:predicted methyltransferase